MNDLPVMEPDLGFYMLSLARHIAIELSLDGEAKPVITSAIKLLLSLASYG